jgi:hypothetical protein
MPVEALQKIFSIAPPVFFGGAFLYVAYLFFRAKESGEAFRKKIKRTLFATASFRLLNVAGLTLAQYYVWAKDPATRIFLEQGISATSPIAESLKGFPFFFGKLGYFLFYSYGRFWLNVFIVFLCAFIFYLFLKALQKWKARFFEIGEIELGALAVLLVGWPGFVIFIAAAFISVILVSLFRLVAFREPYTTLGAPFLLAVALVFLFGGYALYVTGLAVLKI